MNGEFLQGILDIRHYFPAVAPMIASEKSAFCAGCLSQGRHMTGLDTLQATYGMLIEDFIKQDAEGSPPAPATQMCWECAAALRRIASFKRRVQCARSALLLQHHKLTNTTKDTESNLISMSQLKTKCKNDFDYTFKFNHDFNSVVTDCKIEGLVKVEKSDDEDSEVANPIDIANHDYKITFPYDIEPKVFPQIHPDNSEEEDSTAFHFTETAGDANAIVPKVEVSSKKRRLKDKSPKKVTRMKREKKKKKEKAIKDEYCEEDKGDIQKNDWRCRFCEQIFGTRGKMTYHQRTVHTDPVLCNECGRVFSFKPTLEKHMLTHFGGVPQYPCAVCGKSFAGRAGIKSHMIHMHAAGADCYRCEPCDLSFKTKYKYRTHLKWSKRHGGEGTERHECEKCHRKYKTKQRLFEHFSYQHLGKAAHKCNICGKEISSLLSLQKHMKYVHEGQEKPRTHVCETCGDAFKQVSMLRQHQYIHSGERPFACDECGARFRQKGSLYTHRRLVHLKLKRPPPPPRAPL